MISMKPTAEGFVTVRFTEWDLGHAAMVGFIRQVQNVSRGLKDGYGFRGDGWGAHINGALGEAAVACYLDRFWAIGTMRGTDVNEYQVRTRLRDDYDLILHPKDPDEQIYFLVTANPPDFTIRGWIVGCDGKQQQWWRDPAGGRPAYFVPQSKLRSLADFAVEVAV